MNKTSYLKENSLIKVYPKAIDEWDFEKNDELGINIYDVTYGSNKTVWWKCEKGHSYTQPIKRKTSGCKVCNNRELLVGYNDMWTTNPSLASMLLNKEDGYKYMQNSHKKVDWKCPTCGEIAKNKRISDVNTYGLSCKYCSDGVSYPEKVVREVLKQLGVDYIYNQVMEWSLDRRYDFFVPSIEAIIEVHGGQHKNGGFKTMGGKTLEEEIENDRFKKELALNNNIKHYIEINADTSDLLYIKNEILKSKLSKLFNLSIIDWIEVEVNSQKSISHECLELWNKGVKDIKEIGSTLNIHKEAVRRYLIQWSKIGKCDYHTHRKNKRRIVQLNENNEVIRIYESIREANLTFTGNNNSSDINYVLNGVLENAFGYKWSYFEDYEHYLGSGTFKKTIKNSAKNVRPVVKLDKDYNFLKAYNSITEASKDNSIKSFHHITNCCKGKRNFVGGFRWMYKEDYEKEFMKSKLNIS